MKGVTQNLGHNDIIFAQLRSFFRRSSKKPNVDLIKKRSFVNVQRLILQQMSTIRDRENGSKRLWSSFLTNAGQQSALPGLLLLNRDCYTNCKRKSVCILFMHHYFQSLYQIFGIRLYLLLRWKKIAILVIKPLKRNAATEFIRDSIYKILHPQGGAAWPGG